MFMFKTEHVGLTIIEEHENGDFIYRLSEHEDEIDAACDMSYFDLFGYILFPTYSNIERL